LGRLSAFTLALRNWSGCNHLQWDRSALKDWIGYRQRFLNRSPDSEPGFSHPFDLPALGIVAANSLHYFRL
jgi:hypothetical protein